MVDPDLIGGTLGNLRDVFGLNFARQDFVNSLGDEKNLSNYRILADWVTSLAQSWLSNLPYFGLTSARPFFGTQLVLLSRQLQVVAESVDEVRFTLDSVFIGPAERQTVRIVYPSATGLPAIFLEDLLGWVYNFSTVEGPALVQDGGKFAVKNTFTPVVQQLLQFLNNIPSASSSLNPIPPGFFAPRVTLSRKDLSNQLQTLLNLASPIDHQITSEPDFGLAFNVVQVGPLSQASLLSGSTPPQIYVRGNGFQVGARVDIPPFTSPTGTFFRSEGLLVVNIAGVPAQGAYDVTVTNADLTPVTVKGGFVVGP